MNDPIHELFAGHLRSICGGLAIAGVIHSREALTGEVRRSGADEVGQLGLVIDSPQIRGIDDSSGVDGGTELLTKALAMGGTGLGLARKPAGAKRRQSNTVVGRS
jgi:hypothetical protein